MRGSIGAALNPALAMDFAAAYGTLLSGGRILLARDSRSSSPLLSDAVAAALCSCGCEVADGGVMHAGMVHFLVPALGFDGALYISGGHQKAGWNSIIPIGSDGAHFNYISQRELFDLFHSRQFTFCRCSGLKKTAPVTKAERRKYWKFLAKVLDIGAISRAKLTIAADWCNGAGAAGAEEFGRLLGINLVSINDRPSGVLPRNPEPGSGCGSPLASLMTTLKADAGLIFNSDMSRMSLCPDGADYLLSEEYTLPLALDYLLPQTEHPGKVFTNICSSMMNDAVVKMHGGTLEKGKVGQSPVIDSMKVWHGDFGGEGSGSFTAAGAAENALWGFDGFFMAGKMIESIAREMKLSWRIRRLPKYFMQKVTLPCRQAHAYTKLRQLPDMYRDAVSSSTTDGWRFDWPDGFLSIRLSSTESLVRVISESKRERDCKRRAEYTLRFLSQSVG